MWKLIISLACLTLLPSTSSVMAKLRPIALVDAVRAANLVFVGTVEYRSDHPVIESNTLSWGVVKVRVDQIVCGTFETDHRSGRLIEFMYKIGMIDQPRFEEDSKFLFLYARTTSTPGLAPSFSGALPISEQGVHAFFTDVNGVVPLKDFIDLIHCDDLTDALY